MNVLSLPLPLLLTFLLLSLSLSSAAYSAPSSVMIGVCFSSSSSESSMQIAAVQMAVEHANQDSTIIPYTDIVPVFMDCANPSAVNTLLSNSSILALISDDSGATASSLFGKSLILTSATSSELGNGSYPYVLRLAASRDTTVRALFDLYTVFINPSFRGYEPDPSSAPLHIVADNEHMLTLATKYAAHNSMNITSAFRVDSNMTPLQFSITVSDLQSRFVSGKKNTVFFLGSDSTVVDGFVNAAATINLFSTAHIALSSDALDTLLTLSLSTQLAARGAVAPQSSSGYINRNDIFDASFAGPYTLQALRAYDAVMVFARGLTPLLAVASNPPSWNRGDLVFAQLKAVSFVGTSGPVIFQSNGEIKNSRFAYRQVDGAGTTIEIGHWSPVVGPSLDGPSSILSSTIWADVAGGEPIGWSDSGNYHAWYPVPSQGVPPPARYGACTVISKAINAILVLGGTASATSVPYTDVWAFLFVNQLWRNRPVPGTKPDARYYAACTISDDFVYMFGGLSISGIKGDLWKFKVSTNSWQLLDIGGLVGTAQRSQAGFVGDSTVLSVFGGRHRTTIDAEIWSLSIASETFDVIRPTYDPQSWVQPTQPPYKDDLTILSLLNTLIGPVSVRTTIMGRDVYVVVGGYQQSTDVALIYDTFNRSFSPLYTFGANPNYRSLTQGVMIGTKMYVSHGWDQKNNVNYNSVYTLDLNCPSATCGKWELDGSWGDKRDSFSQMQFGNNLIATSGWGAETVHNDLILYSTSNRNHSTFLHTDYVGPPLRKYHSVAVVGAKMIVWGGLDSNQVSRNTLHFLDIDSEAWSSQQSLNDAPASRYAHSAVTVRMEMIIFGGQNELGNFFSDVCAYSLYTNQWRCDTLTTSTSSVWPSARAYHGSFAINDRYVYIYSGVSNEGACLRDLYRYDVPNGVWKLIYYAAPFAATDEALRVILDSYAETVTVPTTVSEPAPNIQAVILYNNNLMYQIGGQDSGLNPVSKMFAYDLNSNVWYQYPSMPSPRVSHAGAVMDHKLYIFGGVSYEVVSNDLMVYDVATHKWSTIPTSSSWSVPRGMAGLSMAVYGNSISVFGGSSAEFSDVHNPFYFLPEVWQYFAGIACNDSTTTQINGQSCTHCAPGTIPKYSYCLPCPTGSYWKVGDDGIEYCQPCSPGFAGHISGANSFALCLPCESGKYAPNEGSSSCVDCNSGNFCPVGSSKQLPQSTPVTLISAYQLQPTPFSSDQSRVLHATTILSYVLLACVIALIICYAVVLWLKPFNFWTKFDVLYNMSHFQKIEKPLIMRRTNMGGGVSLLAILVIVYLIITLTLPFSLDNIIETRSLIPNVSVNTSFTGDLTAQVTLNGYSGSCTASGSGNTSLCASGITVDFQDSSSFIGAANATYTCEIVPDETYRSGNASADDITSDLACLVTYECHDCGARTVTSRLIFTFAEENTWASSVFWLYSTESGYPNQQSTLYGSIYAEDDRLFKGQRPATQIEIKSTQSYYEELYNSYTQTGYHNNYISATPGQKTLPKDFYSENGVRVEFDLELVLDTLNIVRTQKRTIVQFIGELLGTISGAIAGLGVALSVLETLEDMLLPKFKRFMPATAPRPPPKKKFNANEFSPFGSKGKLFAIFEHNDDKVVNQAIDRIETAMKRHVKVYHPNATVQDDAFSGLREEADRVPSILPYHPQLDLQQSYSQDVTPSRPAGNKGIELISPLNNRSSNARVTQVPNAAVTPVPSRPVFLPNQVEQSPPSNTSSSPNNFASNEGGNQLQSDNSRAQQPVVVIHPPSTTQ